MDKKTKQFLINIVVVAMVGWIAGNVLLGGPGLSKDYLARYRAEHEHYITIIKSDAYKQYVERPNLAHLDEDPALRAQVDFVASYTAREAFAAEAHRRELRAMFFDFFNASLVVVLLWTLGRPPLLRFLEEQATAVRERLNQATRARSAASTRLVAAQDRLSHIHEDELKVNTETDGRLERALAELSASNHYSFGLHEQDLIERKRAAEHTAELLVRRALVEKALALAQEQLTQSRSEEHEALHINQFIRGLEAKG